MIKNAVHIFSVPTVMSSICLFFFFQTNSTKPKPINFTVIHDKEKQPILSFEKMNVENF